MKTTKRGYRVNKNGKVLKTIEQYAIVKNKYEGNLIKINGTYYYLNRKQGNNYIYL